MFNFLKKNKKEFTEKKQVPQVEKKRRKSPTQDEEIAFLEAKNCLNEMQGIMSRYTYWLKKLGKDQSDKEKSHIAWIEEREVELYQEEHNLDLYNEAYCTKVWDFYAPLIKEYFDSPEYDEDIAKNGLPHKYITTKLDLSKFDTVKRT